MSNSAQNLLQLISGSAQQAMTSPSISLEQLNLPPVISTRRQKRILAQAQMMLDLFNAFGTRSVLPDGGLLELTVLNDVKSVVLYDYDEVSYFRTISQLDLLASTLLTVARIASNSASVLQQNSYGRTLGFDELMYVTDLLADAIGPFGKHEIFDLNPKVAACAIVTVFNLDPPAVAALLNSPETLNARVLALTYIDAEETNGLGEYLINAGTRKIEQTIRRLCAVHFYVRRDNIDLHPDLSEIKSELKKYC